MYGHNKKINNNNKSFIYAEKNDRRIQHKDAGINRGSIHEIQLLSIQVKIKSNIKKTTKYVQ